MGGDGGAHGEPQPRAPQRERPPCDERVGPPRRNNLPHNPGGKRRGVGDARVDEVEADIGVSVGLARVAGSEKGDVVKITSLIECFITWLSFLL